ncbi:hypothetical protein Esti_003089 [Eimeria stiedai]
MFSAWHPQTDGQTERANCTIEQMLRTYIQSPEEEWPDLLPALELAYNCINHSATGLSPFEGILGENPLRLQDLFWSMFFHPLSPLRRLKPFDSLLTEPRHISSRQSGTQKAFADSSRRPLEFSVGDLVWVSTPYIAARGCPKCQQRHIGPYRILERIGPAAYKLQLPPSMLIHPVFHVSLLSAHRLKPQDMTSLPEWKSIGNRMDLWKSNKSRFIRPNSGLRKDTRGNWTKPDQDSSLAICHDADILSFPDGNKLSKKRAVVCELSIVYSLTFKTVSVRTCGLSPNIGGTGVPAPPSLRIEVYGHNHMRPPPGALVDTPHEYPRGKSGAKETELPSAYHKAQQSQRPGLFEGSEAPTLLGSRESRRDASAEMRHVNSYNIYESPIQVVKMCLSTSYVHRLVPATFDIQRAISNLVGLENFGATVPPPMTNIFQRFADRATANILQAQVQQKHYADAKQEEAPFELGDEVWVPPKSMQARGAPKLQPRFIGPSKMLCKTGTAAYKLDLPLGMQVHPVFHVALLRKDKPKSPHMLWPSGWKAVEEETEEDDELFEVEPPLDPLGSGQDEEPLMKCKGFPEE